MKIYSNDSVTHEQVEATAKKAAEDAAFALDMKQSRQISQLRVWCGVLTMVVVLQTVAFISLL